MVILIEVVLLSCCYTYGVGVIHMELSLIESLRESLLIELL